MDFAEIEHWQQTGDWAAAAQRLAAAARSLERAGADCVLLCTNTMHKVADEIQAQLTIPFLHIADAAAQAIQAAGLTRVGLLGTRFTMEEPFYTARLAQHGLEALIPAEAARAVVHRVIYEELVQGVIRPDSQVQYLAIIAQLVAAGAQGIILGCTEIGLLVTPASCPTPLFDTTRLHVEAAVAFALAE